MTLGLKARLSVICLLVLPLLAGQCAGPALVVCVAAGQHIQIETIGARCCERPLLPTPAELTTASDCGGCTDLPLLVESLPDPARRASQPVAASLSLALPPAFLFPLWFGLSIQPMATCNSSRVPATLPTGLRC